MTGRNRGMGAAVALAVFAWAAPAEAQSTFAPTRDTYVDSSTTGTTTNFGNSDRLSMERNSSGLNERSYLHFDVSSLNGQAVTSAILRCWVTRENSGGSALDRYEILEVLSPWTDSLTWDSSQGLSLGPIFLQMDSVDYGANNTVDPAQPVDFDITGLVQSWVSGGGNEGIMIRLENTASADIRFASMNHANAAYHPELTVTTSGTTPPPGPGPAPGPGPGPGPSATSGARSSDDDGNCSCSTIAPPSRIWWALLVPFALLLFRRRRTIA